MQTLRRLLLPIAIPAPRALQAAEAAGPAMDEGFAGFVPAQVRASWQPVAARRPATAGPRRPAPAHAAVALAR